MKKIIFFLIALITCIGAQAAQAAQPQTLDITICRYDTMFFDETNDVYMILYTEGDVVTLRLDIFVEEGQRGLTNGKTYTWDEMYQKFCYVYVGAEFQGHAFKDANITWTKDAQGLEHIAGYAIDTLDNTYNFHYDDVPFIPTGDTIAVSFPGSLRLEHYQSDWYFSGTNSDGAYSLMLTLLNDGDSPVGHYTAENIDLTYSYLDKSLGDGGYELLYFHDATADITAAENDTLVIHAEVMAQDGIVYVLEAFYSEPKALRHEQITATDLYINTDYLYGMVGAIRVEASDDQRRVVLALTPETADLSVYDTYQLSAYTPNLGNVTYFIDPETPYEVYKGTVTVERAENGAVVTGTLLCYNDVEYTLHLTSPAPDKTREEELNMDAMHLTVSTQGAWRINGYSADSTVFVSAVFNNDRFDGTYSIVEMSRDYSYIVTDITWSQGDVESYTYYDLVSARLTAELDPADSTITVTGTMLGQHLTDVPLFSITLTTKPRQESALPITTGSPAVATKRLENGLLLIERNGKTYTVTGAEMR